MRSPFCDAHADAEWVSSALLRIEVTRAVARAMRITAAAYAGLATISPRN